MFFKKHRHCLLRHVTFLGLKMCKYHVSLTPTFFVCSDNIYVYCNISQSNTHNSAYKIVVRFGRF